MSRDGNSRGKPESARVLDTYIILYLELYLETVYIRLTKSYASNYVYVHFQKEYKNTSGLCHQFRIYF